VVRGDSADQDTGDVTGENGEEDAPPVAEDGKHDQGNNNEDGGRGHVGDG
jgi:hypothetical protein